MKTIRYGGLVSVTLFVLALLVAPLSGSPALAQCGGTDPNIVCTGTDTDGYQDSTPFTGVNITVESGATVSNGGGDAIFAGSGSTVTNNGTVSATGASNEGVYVFPGSTINNNGSIATTGNSAAAVRLDGSGNQITNNGTISTSGSGSDAIGGTSGNTIINNGSLATTGTGAGIFQYGSASTTTTITNTGTITANGDGILIWNGNTNIDHSGDIAATGRAISTGNGTDTVLLDGNVTGDVNTGGGNDAVTVGASNPRLNGELNGGAGTDTLTFALTVTSAEAPALAAAIAAASPAGGTLTYGGNVYEWVNFETLINALNIIAGPGGGGGGGGGGTGGGPVVVLVTIHAFADGRLNNLDFAATAIPFCGLGGKGLDIYAVAGGQIDLAFQVSVEQVQAALAAANGASVQVAPEVARLGAALFALDGDTLQLNGPDGYSFIFQANVCGLG